MPEILSPSSLAEWQAQRHDIQRGFLNFLGGPSAPLAALPPAELRAELSLPWCTARLYAQPTCPDVVQNVLLLFPCDGDTSAIGVAPAAVVPFYHPDESCGWDLGRALPHLSPPLPPRNRPDEPLDASFTIQYGRHLVEQGYIVACTEVFAYNLWPLEGEESGFSRFHAATTKLLSDHPGWTGMGKMVADVRLATDLLLDQPQVDTSRVLCIGHSLGGKMAFYSGALDSRFSATVCSDFGIGFDFTNWDAPWYLGDRTNHGSGVKLELGHEHLLALHAPRAFLLIAGEADRASKSRPYLDAVRDVWAVYTADASNNRSKSATGAGTAHSEDLWGAVSMYDHGTGHRPTQGANDVVYRWLASQFGGAAAQSAAWQWRGSTLPRL